MPRTIVEPLADLVAIDSVDPSLVTGGAGERETAAHVAASTRDAGGRGAGVRMTAATTDRDARTPVAHAGLVQA